MGDQPYYYQNGGNNNNNSTDKSGYPAPQQGGGYVPQYGAPAQAPYVAQPQNSFQSGNSGQQGYGQQQYPQQGAMQQQQYPQQQYYQPQPGPTTVYQQQPQKSNNDGLCAGLALGACLCCCFDCLT
ncbi:hypothetical protein DFJ77DRAFT_462905 [Powellomyces hirtus]|nr:hypothetical protein DFJ77DRAFT_462905 [Powellomyces hirtus]